MSWSAREPVSSVPANDLRPSRPRHASLPDAVPGTCDALRSAASNVAIRRIANVETFVMRRLCDSGQGLDHRPRFVLISITPRFIFARAAASIRWCDSGVGGHCTVTTSLRRRVRRGCNRGARVRRRRRSGPGHGRRGRNQSRSACGRRPGRSGRSRQWQRPFVHSGAKFPARMRLLARCVISMNVGIPGSASGRALFPVLGPGRASGGQSG